MTDSRGWKKFRHFLHLLQQALSLSASLLLSSLKFWLKSGLSVRSSHTALRAIKVPAVPLFASDGGNRHLITCFHVIIWGLLWLITSTRQVMAVCQRVSSTSRSDCATPPSLTTQQKLSEAKSAASRNGAITDVTKGGREDGLRI